MNFWTQPLSRYLGVDVTSMHASAGGLQRNGSVEVLRQKGILKGWDASIFNSVRESGHELPCAKGKCACFTGGR